MHSPMLLAGIVLTFGAIALANLYLPPGDVLPSSRQPTTSPAIALPPQEEGLLYLLHGNSSLYDEAVEQLDKPVEPINEVTEEPGKSSSQAAPEASGASTAAADVAVVLSNSTSAAEAATREASPTPAANKETPSTAARTTPAPQEQTRRTAANQPSPSGGASAHEASPSRAGAREQTPSAARTTQPVASSTSSRPISSGDVAPADRFAAVSGYPAPSGTAAHPTGVSVSAILGERAWVRVNDTQTLMVIAGDHVPSLGTVKSVEEGRVEFDNGSILEVVQ